MILFVYGPAVIKMISQRSSPPVPIPVQVPPGHFIHQVSDENGTLTQIFLSSEKIVTSSDGSVNIEHSVTNNHQTSTSNLTS